MKIRETVYIGCYGINSKILEPWLDLGNYWKTQIDSLAPGSTSEMVWLSDNTRKQNEKSVSINLITPLQDLFVGLDILTKQ